MRIPAQDQHFRAQFVSLIGILSAAADSSDTSAFQDATGRSYWQIFDLQKVFRGVSILTFHADPMVSEWAQTVLVQLLAQDITTNAQLWTRIDRYIGSVLATVWSVADVGCDFQAHVDVGEIAVLPVAEPTSLFLTDHTLLCQRMREVLELAPVHSAVGDAAPCVVRRIAAKVLLLEISNQVGSAFVAALNCFTVLLRTAQVHLWKELFSSTDNFNVTSPVLGIALNPAFNAQCLSPESTEAQIASMLGWCVHYATSVRTFDAQWKHAVFSALLQALAPLGFLVEASVVLHMNCPRHAWCMYCVDSE